jgi:hypothetical protein
MTADAAAERVVHRAAVKEVVAGGHRTERPLYPRAGESRSMTRRRPDMPSHQVAPVHRRPGKAGSAAPDTARSRPSRPDCPPHTNGNARVTHLAPEPHTEGHLPAARAR